MSIITHRNGTVRRRVQEPNGIRWKLSRTKGVNLWSFLPEYSERTLFITSKH